MELHQQIQKRINEILYKNIYAPPTLETVLLALNKTFERTGETFCYAVGIVYNHSNPLSDIHSEWHLGKPLSQQPQETLLTLKDILTNK